MSDEIIKVIDELGKRFGIVIDWSNENVLPYIQELARRFIIYRTAMGIMAIVISVILIVIFGIGMKKLLEWRKSEKFSENIWDDDLFIFFLAMIGCVIGICIAAGVIIGNTSGIIKNLIMPELTILEYIKPMIGGN